MKKNLSKTIKLTNTEKTKKILSKRKLNNQISILNLFIQPNVFIMITEFTPYSLDI